METNQNFKLINGKFSAEEVEGVITASLNYKIDYYNRKDFLYRVPCR